MLVLHIQLAETAFDLHLLLTTDSQLVYHSWNFGDGSAVQNVYAPSHVYSDTGTYMVTQYIVKA